MDWKKLIEILRGHKVYIQTHNYPDPDAMACGLGLQVFLRHHGIESIICYDGTIETLSAKRMVEVFQFEVYNIKDIPDMTESDYIVTVDAQKYNANITDFIGDEVACIDHHPTYVECDYLYKDIRLVGACSTLIAQYFVESNTPMDQNTATALLYGQRIDTNSLTRGVTPLDIEMFAYLHDLADEDILSAMTNSTMELKDLQAYGAAIQNIEIFENLGFAEIPFDCPDGLIAMVSDFILNLDVVEFAVIYARRENGLKFSVRSELNSLNAGSIVAEALEGIGTGGGHAVMAGGFVAMENVNKMGHLYDDEIEDRFIQACKNCQRLYQAEKK